MRWPTIISRIFHPLTHRGHSVPHFSALLLQNVLLVILSSCWRRWWYDADRDRMTPFIRFPILEMYGRKKGTEKGITKLAPENKKEKKRTATNPAVRRISYLPSHITRINTQHPNKCYIIYFQSYRSIGCKLFYNHSLDSIPVPIFPNVR